jgi:hypothetical protein
MPQWRGYATVMEPFRADVWHGHFFDLVKWGRKGKTMSKQISIKGAVVILALYALAGSEAARAEESLMDAITKGKVDFYARLRYEYVNDGAPVLKNANALTLRTALGYSTGLFYGLGGYLQVQDVRAPLEDFNDGGGNGKVGFASVVDPEGTALQQANLRYEGLPGTVLRVGRQEIEHRQAPMHRYIGNILWRQNWQTFDAVRLNTSFFPDADTGERTLKAEYAYIWNVNRIFGEDNPLPDRSNFRMNSHAFKLNYDGFDLLKLEGYAYVLDFDNPVSFKFSTNTFGLRGEGAKGFGKNWKVLYTGEYAHQMDAFDNPADIGVNYYLVEGGLAYQFGKPWLDTVTVKGSYEVLEGDGTINPGTPNAVGRAFQTPLGTNHAFQGWADRFLITPGDGIEDLFATLKLTGLGATAMLVYHDFSANNGGYSYGSEWDAVVEKPFATNWLVGVKYANYDASNDALNVARNTGSGQAFDLEKFWAYVQFKF